MHSSDYLTPLKLSSSGWAPSWSETVVGTLVVVACIQFLVKHFDLPILSVPEYLWNLFVWLMPSSLVFGLRGAGPSHAETSNDPSTANSARHAAKSEALRTILGFGSGRQNGGSEKTGELRAVPKGLGNWDNSCYQNSILQALAASPSMTAFLEDVLEHLDGMPSSSTIEALHTLSQTLNRSTDGGGYTWTPAKLKSMSSWQQQDAQEYFSKIADEMEKEVKKALVEEPVQEKTGGLESAALEVKDPRVLLEKITAIENNPRIKSFPTDGLLAQRVGCTRCGYSEGLTLIPFNCLTLPLGRGQEYTMEECLNEYTALESIEGVECGKCTLTQAKAKLQKLIEALSKPENLSTEADATAEARQSAQLDDIKSRFEAVSTALETEDFADSTISKKCRIASNARVSTTKSRQAVVVRAPQYVVVHINRSIFDEMTGEQRKNYANVECPERVDLSKWSLGISDEEQIVRWEMDPTKSMIPVSSDLGRFAAINETPNTAATHELRALVTHYGRHENGHYVCYRRIPSDDTVKQGSKWWRISDETVTEVSLEETLEQQGVFMAFYERLPASKQPLVEMDGTPAPEEVSQALQTALEASSEPAPAVAADIDHLDTLSEAESLTPSSSEVTHTDVPSSKTSFTDGTEVSQDCQDTEKAPEQQYFPTHDLLEEDISQSDTLQNESSSQDHQDDQVIASPHMLAT